MQVKGAVAYGIRCLSGTDPSSLRQFQTDFNAFINQHADCLHAALAFPEHRKDNSPTRLHIVLWHKTNDDDAIDASLNSLSSKAFDESPQEGDGVFHIFRKRSGTMHSSSKKQDNNIHKALQKEVDCAFLEGYLRSPSAKASDKADMPMIGVFRRAVQPGHRDELGKSFRSVCEIWHETVPGILGAMVFADPHDENMVHDVRIFANKKSYDAHVDKSNPKLVKAMEDWFSHYDTSVPHKGIMIAEDTSDPATRSSSIKDRPVQVNFFVFHYGQDDNCMGQVLGNDAC